MAKLRRNDPCWCGSGKKFKRCHLNRADQMRPALQEVIEEEGKASAKYCLHPHATWDCSGPIIRAHSIQRTGGLSKIAREGHVYTVIPTFGDLLRSDGRIEPKLTGVVQATTFTGLCSKHDSTTFRSIETAPLAASEEHCFLLGYRALSQALFAKRFQHRLLELQKTLDRGLPEVEQVLFQREVQSYSTGVDMGLRDLNVCKQVYDGALLAQYFSIVKYYMIWFDATPDVLCTGAGIPEMDFTQKWVYTPDEYVDPNGHFDIVCFALIPTDTGGVAVFTWLGESEKCSQFVKSVNELTDDEVPDAMLRFAFEVFENVAIAPAWWDALSDATRQSFVRRINSNVGPQEPRISCLRDEGIRTASIRVTGRSTNL